MRIVPDAEVGQMYKDLERSSFVYKKKETTVGTRVCSDENGAAPTITQVVSVDTLAQNAEDVKRHSTVAQDGAVARETESPAEQAYVHAAGKSGSHKAQEAGVRLPIGILSAN